ncbi:serine hydrolase domain-containing protein [Jiangella asiatica]|uniref:Class A beta-lactamase-related serine hydrolase n=1 Tax=Jiangella asiatica TaxID=2530372 RepID=A0A4V2Z3D5_9ACTN|nr:serine hydrolase domain-containing protein [Jiangella asiatica]TDE12278.1 class A beta-lactamase-related serine hydrolase [Jiangella asiatica]
MRRQLLIFLTVVASLLPAALVAVPAVSAARAPDTADLDTALLERALDAVDAAGMPGVVVEVRDGDERWTSARGERDPSASSPEAVETTDLFRVGSVTKSMVTTVLLQLVDEGRLGLDDPVAGHLPGVLPYKEPITVRQLLGHTSGVPDYFVDVYPSLARRSADDVERNLLRYYRPEQLVGIATQRPLDFAPDQYYSYSNTGYYVIGLLIEEITGNAIEDELARRVFEPAGLTDTSFPRFSPVIDGEHANAYYATEHPGEPHIDTTRLSPTQLWAAGAVVSTSTDINTFFRAMFDGTLVPAELLAEAFELTTQSRGTYGLGIQAAPAECPEIAGGIAYGHTGGTLGHTTYSFGSPDGSRHLTVTLTLDDQLAPSEELGAALNGMLVAGLCGIDVTETRVTGRMDLLGRIETVLG